MTFLATLSVACSIGVAGSASKACASKIGRSDSTVAIILNWDFNNGCKTYGTQSIPEVQKVFPVPATDALRDHLFKRTDVALDAADAERDSISSISQLDKRKAFMKQIFIESMGGLPPSNTPLNAMVTGVIKQDGFRIEKVIYESRPNTHVTANLYIPDGITEPRGAVLFLCGHNPTAKSDPVSQRVCRHLVKAGLVVLAQDCIGQGERISYYYPEIGDMWLNFRGKEHDYEGAPSLLLGDGLARYFVHDGMRGVDYLMTRPEVDPKHIGVTGYSGGGTQTTLMMVCDDRIAAAAPCCFLMNRRIYRGGQDCEQIWRSTTAYGFDHEDILLAMCPKPVRVLGAKEDGFPIVSTRRTVEKVKPFYKIRGVPDNLDMVEDDCGHDYSPNLAKASAEFFALHLLGKKITSTGEGTEAIDQNLLVCTKTGQVMSEFKGSRTPQDENVSRLKQIEKARRAIPEAERKQKALDWLRNRVFAHRTPCDLDINVGAVTPCFDIAYRTCDWKSQQDLRNQAFLFRNAYLVGKKLPVTIALWDGGTRHIQPNMTRVREILASGREVMILDVSGMGSLIQEYNMMYDFYGSVHLNANNLMWLDDDIVSLRTYDVLRALDVLQKAPDVDAKDIRFYTRGRYNVYAELASALDPRIKSIESAEGLKSFASIVNAIEYDRHDIFSVIFPCALQYFDLPDLAKWRKRN